MEVPTNNSTISIVLIELSVARYKQLVLNPLTHVYSFTILLLLLNIRLLPILRFRPPISV
jgi:hypothetical protein